MLEHLLLRWNTYFYTGMVTWKQRLYTIRIYDKYSGFAVLSATTSYMVYFEHNQENNSNQVLGAKRKP